MYKKASKLKLRIETSKGLLSVENIWDLSQNQLAKLLRDLKSKMKKDSDDELSFLDDSVNQVNEVTELTFNIVKDIYLTKKEDNEVLKKESENKANNQRILELIKRKQDSELEEKSIEELEKMLK